MERIAVIGSPGAGKSTLSRRLGEALGLSVVHLDRLFWRPGWVETPRPEWHALQEDLVRQERWIIDGNYGGSLGIRLNRATAVVFLDYPPLLCLWGALKRRVQHRRGGRPDMAEGCPEAIDLPFLRFIWTFRREGRPRIEAKLAELPAGVSVYRLRSRAEADAFLASISAFSGHQGRNPDLARR
ncbi:MAG TPA: AAA family ATPase [Symbiobacteriaceae bacterium]|nr:AAA family ATPase [Symbiobacteriaceae bacterium]